jgi:ABC-type polysaccharide/polyol phosphate transport system ATPase subunit
MITHEAKKSKTELAIHCEDVYKSFCLVDEKNAWKLVLNCNKNHAKIPILKGINISVPKGEFFGILGRNGAGKSTLLRVLAGVYDKDSGIICVNGKLSSLFEMGGMGQVHLTGRKYAKRFLMLQDIPKNKIDGTLNEIVEFSELGAFYDKPIVTYSMGMQARLYFAVATSVEHKLYLVDEILSVGDERFQAKCWKRLRERFLNGASGLLVTHDWSAVLKLCKKAGILQDGLICTKGPSEKIIHHYLQLPVPSKKYASLSFLGDVSQQGDLKFLLGINLKESISVELHVSIELLKPGYGWEIVSLSKATKLDDLMLGDNHIEVCVKQCSISPGQYRLNCFLTSPQDSIDALDLDGFSWTYGNGRLIEIKGGPSESICNFPWKKNVKVVSHGS